jgi:hypothetical protein
MISILSTFYVQKVRKRCCQQIPEPATSLSRRAGGDVGRNFSAFEFIIEIYMMYFQHFFREYWPADK